MVIRRRLRRFLIPLVLYSISAAVAAYFVHHAHSGARGIESQEKYEAQMAELNKELSRITGVRAIASVRGPFQRGGGGGGGGGTNVDLIAVGNDYVQLAEWLKPIADEMRRLMADPAEIDRILAAGAEKARAVAEPIMLDIKKTVGFVV